MLEQQYPALWQFFGAYLHQDWREEYDSPSAALRDFVSASPALAADLPAEVERVLASSPDDENLEAALVSLGSFFVPSRDGQDPRNWLRHLKDEAHTLLQVRE